ncbi:MAG TPA: cupin domain-containing protein [Candidatus Polarisedimenticolia bacterium]|nr:cupin domain-containing protein [Candidatus Polarisedimenticolia bacterium]
MPVYRLQFSRKMTDITGRESVEFFGPAEGHSDLSAAWWMLPPECRTAERSDEAARAIIVLSGSGRVWLQGRPDDLAAGYAVYVPPATAWRLENMGRVPLVCYAIAAPALADPAAPLRS